MKRVALTFVLAFALNLIWENLHSVLYVSYKGGAITEYILARASLFDAFLIVVISLPFFLISFFRERIWIMFSIATIVAIVNEWYGLSTGRWVYTSYMPIVPFVHVGLTPMLQLGILGVFTMKIQEYLSARYFA